MGGNDAVDIQVNIIPSKSSLTQTRDEITAMLNKALIVSSKAQQPEVIKNLMEGIREVGNEITRLQGKFEDISNSSVEFNMDKTLSDLEEVEHRIEEIEEFREKGSQIIKSDAIDTYATASHDLEGLNAQLTRATTAQEEYNQAITNTVGLENQRARREAEANQKNIKAIQMQIDQARFRQQLASESIEEVNQRLQIERAEEQELRNQQSLLRSQSDEWYDLRNNVEALQQYEKSRTSMASDTKSELEAQKQELVEMLRILGQIIQKEGKRQGINIDTGKQQGELSKEERKALVDRQKYLQRTSAQYYYQLRALKMVSHAMDTMNTATNKWGKGLLSTIGRVTKGMFKLGTGFILLRKNMNKTTTGHKSFLTSLKSGIWAILKYGLGIRSLYFLFRKLRSAISDGMETLATQFSHVNRQMSSLTTSFYMMKNASAAMVQPLLNVLAPLLERLAALFNRLAVAIASFFAALTGQKFIYKANRATQSYIDGQKGAKKATDDTNKSLKQQLASFDKLNLLTTEKDKDKDSGGGGGVGDAFDTVPIEDKWKDLADKIKRIAKDLFYPIKMAWLQEGQFVIDSWKKGLQEVWKLVKDVGRDFLIMWQQDATVAMWRDIFHIVGDIGLIVGNFASRLREAWNANQIGLKIFEDIRDIIAIIIHGIREAADYTVKWSASLNFYPILEAIHNLLVKIKPLIQTITDLCVYLWKNVILKLQKFLIEQGLPSLLNIIGEIIEKIDKAKLSERLKKLMDAFEPFLEKTFKSLVIVIGDLGNAVADFINSDEFGKFVDYLVKMMKQAKPETIAKAIERIAKALIEFKVALAIVSKLTKFIVVWKTFRNLIIQTQLRQELMGINAALNGTSIASMTLKGKLISAFKGVPEKLASLKLGLKGVADTILNIGSGKVSLGAVLGNGLTQLRSWLGVLGQVLVSIGSIATEFGLVSSGIKDIQLGTDNMGVAVTKVIAGISIGVAGLVVALGPTGLLVAGLTAIVAATYGVNRAFEEIKENAINESISNVLTDSGGTPLEDRFETLTNQIHEFANGFTEISSKSGDLELAKTHVHDVWTEIELIRERMNTGVISVEEGTTKLNELFAELKDNTGKSFEELDKTILASFGEGSAIRKIYEMLGYDVSGLTDAIVASNGTIQDELQRSYEEMERITNEMSELDPTNPKYQELSGQLDDLSEHVMKLDGTFKTSNQELDNYKSYLDVNRLDFKSFVNLDDATIDTEKIGSMFADLKTTTNEGKVEAVSALNTAASELQDEISRLEEVAKFRKLSSEEQQNLSEAKMALAFIPAAIEETQSQFDEASKSLTDDIQTYMIKSIPAVMEEATANWEQEANTHWFPKVWKAMHPKDEWVAEAVSKYTESIGEVSDTVQAEFGNMGGKATGWGRGVTEKALEGMVSEDVTHGEMWSTAKTTLSDSWQEAYQQAANEADTYRVGKAMSDNLITGSLAPIEGAVSTLEPAMKNVTDPYENAANTVEISVGKIDESNVNLNSSVANVGTTAKPAMVPLEEAYSKASNAVASANSSIASSNNGIVSSTTNAVSSASTQMDNLVTKANTTTEDMTSAGADTGQGWQDALIENLSAGIRNAQLKFEGWIKDVKELFGIASPSKVFHSIGDDTIQGFVNGTEDSWNANQSSVTSIFSGLLTDVQEILKPTDFWDIGANVIQGLYDGIVERWDRVKSNVQTIWNGISEGAKRAFDERSPSHVFEKIGQFVIEGLELGIESGTDSVENKFTSMASNLSEETLSIFTNMSDEIESLMTKLEKVASLDNITKQLNSISNIKIPDIAVGYKLPDNPKFNVNNTTDVDRIIKALKESQNEELTLLREQSNILMGILNKEFGISSKQVFDAARNENRRYIRQHGESAFLY